MASKILSLIFFVLAVTFAYAKPAPQFIAAPGFASPYTTAYGSYYNSPYVTSAGYVASPYYASPYYSDYATSYFY